MSRFKARGRFDIVAVFEDGAYVRFTSHKSRSYSAAEIAKCLREYAGYIENGVEAERTAASQQITIGASPPEPKP